MTDWFARATAGADPMARLVREVDWAATSLGAPATWPSALRSAVETCLSTRFPALVVWGPELVMVYNDGYRELLGSAKHPAQGRPVLEVWSEIADQIGPWFASVMATGEPMYWVDTPLVVNRSGQTEEAFFTWCYSVLRDDEARPAGVLDLVQEVTGQIVDRRRLALLSRLSARLAATATDVTGVGRVAAEVLRSDQEEVLAAEVSIRAGDDLLLLSTTQPRRAGLVDAEVLADVVATGTTRVVDGGVVVAPLVGSGESRPDGAVVLRPNPLRPLDAAHTEFLRLLAGTLGAATATALRHARELGELRLVSQTLQLSMLPGLTDVPQAVGRYLPAVGSLAVGGDWYDAVPLGGGRVGLVVGDCVGHGLAAAAVMGQLRSATRALLLEDAGPAAVLRSLDRFAAGLPGAECATVFCAVVDPVAGTVTYSVAGHPPMLAAGPDGARWLDGARSLPLAVVDDVARPEATERLAPGEGVVLFTDGLVERVGEDLQTGLDRLHAVVDGLLRDADDADSPADHLLDRLLPDGGRDDVALLLYLPDASSRGAAAVGGAA